MRLVTILVGFQTTAVIDFRFGEVLLAVLAVSTPHIASLFLRQDDGQRTKDKGYYSYKSFHFFSSPKISSLVIALFLRLKMK